MTIEGQVYLETLGREVDVWQVGASGAVRRRGRRTEELRRGKCGSGHELRTSDGSFHTLICPA